MGVQTQLKHALAELHRLYSGQNAAANADLLAPLMSMGFLPQLGHM
jgi:hypothetical protein